jgi:glycosyltransferase involved in cell wall biosynthesis
MIDFLTHPHHRYTQTFEWLKEATGRPVRMLYGDPDTLREYLLSLQRNPPQLLILFQLEHLAAWASHFCPVLVFPMHDLTRLTPDSYLVSLRNVEWISFSRALHQRLSGLGLSSHYLQYAPDPAGFPQASWDQGAKAYFWERMPAELDERAVRRILAGLGVDSLEVRKLGDSQFSSQGKGEREQAERGWKAREAYLQTLRRFNVYVAPRRHEGIGLAFLEAMAMGMCVVAENQPTANEYILSGKNGILYAGGEERIYQPRRVEPAELARMGREARETIRRIHGEWLAKKVEIGRCVEAMLQLRIKPKVPPAGLLNRTIDFWHDQQGFWESFGSEVPRVWRSGAIEKKGKQTRSLGGRIRRLWRHLKDAARRGSEAVGSDG